MANDKIKFSTGTVVDSSGYLYQVGTQITATAAELNIMDDVSATTAEINRACDISGKVTVSTATALSLTVAAHAEGIVLVNSNSTVANTFTLPAATGSGAKFTIMNNIAQTQGSVVVAAASTDTMMGAAVMVGTTEEACEAFVCSATSDKISLNATTTGGEFAGDIIECWDTVATTWTVKVLGMASGTLATPFSAT